MCMALSVSLVGLWDVKGVWVERLVGCEGCVCGWKGLWDLKGAWVGGKACWM